METRESTPEIRIGMITIANCIDIWEARRFQMALAAADIPSFIPDEATAINAPFSFLGSGPGIRVQVEEEDEIEAKKVISDIREAPKEESDQNEDQTTNADDNNLKRQDEPEEMT